ncbi:MAG: hypothetical protein KQI78_12185 [Deltaproteobacteria bacterium]|nr:hypothetical protein [Deltaproteobacteria bacterium]
MTIKTTNYLEEGSVIMCPKCNEVLAEVIATEPLTIWCSRCGSLELGEDFEYADQTSIETFTKQALKGIDEAVGFDNELGLSDDEVVTDDMLVELDKKCGIDVERSEPDNRVIEEPVVEQQSVYNECSAPKNVERVALNMKPRREFKDRLQQHAKATGESMSAMVERVMGAYIEHCNKGK